MESHYFNPYNSPTIADDGTVSSTRPSRWHGFKTGFLNSAIWSLLLVVPTIPAFYGELTMHRRFHRNTADGTSHVVELMSTESTIAWFVAICSGLTGIALTWAIIAGCVGQARYRKKYPVE